MLAAAAVWMFFFVMPFPQIEIALFMILVGIVLLFKAGRMGMRPRFRTDTLRDTQRRNERDVYSSSGVEIDKRLKKLRDAYYGRGQYNERSYRYEIQKVALPCRRYYERILQTEASVATLLNTDAVRGVRPKDLMQQVRLLSRQIAVLVEQLQLADRLVGFYDAGSDEDIMVQRARQKLIRRADRAMGVLEGVPVRLLQLTTATSNHGLRRLVDDLREMNARLEGKAAAYEAMADDDVYDSALDTDLDLEQLYVHLEATQQRMRSK